MDCSGQVLNTSDVYFLTEAMHIFYISVNSTKSNLLSGHANLSDPASPRIRSLALYPPPPHAPSYLGVPHLSHHHALQPATFNPLFPDLPASRPPLPSASLAAAPGGNRRPCVIQSPDAAPLPRPAISAGKVTYCRMVRWLREQAA